MDDVAATVAEVVDAVEGVLHGKRAAVELAVLCVLARGHLLVEDVPGVGKTSLARAIADVLGGTWHRIQFTPDLLPGDVTGVSVFRPASGTFEFQPGPVFTNVLLADEINRAAPKTQSALLEVMEEHQVTVDGVTRPVPDPFLVVATQNPVELAGTYPLPEAQLDRFLVRLHLGYPDLPTEAALIADPRAAGRQRARTVLDPPSVASLADRCEDVVVAPAIATYVARLVDATRRHPGVLLGASPRAGIGLARVARARAAAAARPYVTPEDVQALAVPVLAHRIVPDHADGGADRDGTSVVERALATVPAPRPAARP